MTVENTQVIDIINVDPITGDVVLNIADHLPFEGHDDHLFVLQEKINTYLSFVESGEILESFPSAKGRSVVIKVICKYAPSQLAKQFFDNAGVVIQDAGLTLLYEVAADD